jgi:hypothetical protein
VSFSAELRRTNFDPVTKGLQEDLYRYRALAAREVTVESRLKYERELEDIRIEENRDRSSSNPVVRNYAHIKAVTYREFLKARYEINKALSENPDKVEAVKKQLEDYLREKAKLKVDTLDVGPDQRLEIIKARVKELAESLQPEGVIPVKSGSSADIKAENAKLREISKRESALRNKRREEADTRRLKTNDLRARRKAAADAEAKGVAYSREFLVIAAQEQRDRTSQDPVARNYAAVRAEKHLALLEARYKVNKDLLGEDPDRVQATKRWIDNDLKREAELKNAELKLSIAQKKRLETISASKAQSLRLDGAAREVNGLGRSEQRGFGV